MSSEVELHIHNNVHWNYLPSSVKQLLGNSQKEYEKLVFTYSLRNQILYKGNLISSIRKDQKKYYNMLIRYSREHLMLYPYHLSEWIVGGLRLTPFMYYVDMMADIMAMEKSYDSLPNFTAADCLRLLGIGRNQYIDLMNNNRSSKKFLRRKSPKGI